MLPSTCARTPSGLIIRPQSCAQATRRTRISPLARSTSTSIAMRDVGLVVLVVDVGEAASAADVAAARRRRRRRAGQPISCATRRSTSAPRGSARSRRRNASGSSSACGGELVGEALDREAVRDLAGRADVRRAQRRRPSASAPTTSTLRRGVGRIAVLRDQPGRQADRLRACRRRAARAAARSAGWRSRAAATSRFRQAAMRPSAPPSRVSSSSCGGPFGSQPCSSSRIHCTRTGLPTACDSSAASAAASS